MRPRRNKFDLSHERKLSFNMGKLIPIMLQEIVPGDSFRVTSELFLRMAPMIAPVMHHVNVFTHYFFVPNRLIWDEWEDFITGGREGTSAPVWPHFSSESAALPRGSLADYFGLPSVGTDATDPIDISLLPFRAYALIWDEYYRDQNLLAALDIAKTSGETLAGAELTKLLALRDRCWEKDYFTSALPWAQRGGEVSVDADITYRDPAEVVSLGGIPSLVSDEGLVTGAGSATRRNVKSGTSDEELRIENLDSIGVSINELRRSIKLQEWLEKNARGGARYIEQILSHFGVRSSDARLQRPEYLGGGKQPIVISEVLTTASNITDDGIPPGWMAGHGASFGKTNGFKRSFEEHGFVIGLMSVLPRTAYQQGVHRMWRRADKLDHFWPEFAHLGEQEIKNAEIYHMASSPAGTKDGTWGYQSRYAEYKYGCSSVHGEFRESLAYWHMGRIFSSLPLLSNEFVTADPTERIFAVEADVDHMYAQIYNRIDALRPMPYFGTPSL